MAPYAQRKLSVLGDDAVKPRGLQPRRRVCACTGFSKNEEDGSLAVGMLPRRSLHPPQPSSLEVIVDNRHRRLLLSDNHPFVMTDSGL